MQRREQRWLRPELHLHQHRGEPRAWSVSGDWGVRLHTHTRAHAASELPLHLLRPQGRPLCRGSCRLRTWVLLLAAAGSRSPGVQYHHLEAGATGHPQGCQERPEATTALVGIRPGAPIPHPLGGTALVPGAQQADPPPRHAASPFSGLFQVRPLSPGLPGEPEPRLPPGPHLPQPSPQPLPCPRALSL